MKLSNMIAEQKTEIKEKCQKLRHELRALERVKEAIGDRDVTSIYAHKLYGVEADLSFGSEYQRYGEEDNRQTMQAAAKLMDEFPPVPVWKIQDGCCALRPDWHVTDEEAMKDGAEKVWGVLLKVSESCQKLQWFTDKNGVRLEITAVLRPDIHPVRIIADKRRDRRTGKTLEVMGCRLETNPQFAGHFWIDQRIKWAAGSAEYANNFTVYWLGVDDSQGAGGAWLEQICGILE